MWQKIKALFEPPTPPSPSAPAADEGVDGMVPDAEAANYVGGGSVEFFKEVGNQLVGMFKAHGGLQPNERVLDVGCGIGRVAIPLTQYLQGGTYEGFDIIKRGIDWCQDRITPRYPNFRFKHADVFNRHYNPTGTTPASAFTFPYREGSFDFVFLTSVFTHMLPTDLEHYAAEIGRVLDKGGRCFCTAYIISAQARTRLAESRSAKLFVARPEGFWTDNPDNPEAAIAYPEEYFTSVFDAAGLQITRTVPGLWWDQPFAQDVMVATRRAGVT